MWKVSSINFTAGRYFFCRRTRNKPFFRKLLRYQKFAANTLVWKSSERQNFKHLTILKHQNAKTSLYKLSKNHWVMILLEIFGCVTRNLRSTVSFDHPVVQSGALVASPAYYWPTDPTPLFPITAVLDNIIGFSLSEPLALYQRQSRDSSAG